MNNSCSTRHTYKPCNLHNPGRTCNTSFRLYIILQYLLSAYI